MDCTKTVPRSLFGSSCFNPSVGYYVKINTLFSWFINQSFVNFVLGLFSIHKIQSSAVLDKVDLMHSRHSICCRVKKTYVIWTSRHHSSFSGGNCLPWEDLDMPLGREGWPPREERVDGRSGGWKQRLDKNAMWLKPLGNVDRETVLWQSGQKPKKKKKKSTKLSNIPL